jgi:hypothetical protein
MPAFLDPPLVPQNGRKLKVLVTCRICGDNQDAKNLDDQEALYQRWLSEHTELPHDMEVLAGRGSGECLDHEEYLLAIEVLATAGDPWAPSLSKEFLPKGVALRVNIQ